MRDPRRWWGHWAPWVLAWVLTRAILLLEWRALPVVAGDVGYYWMRLSQLSTVGLGATMTEYPTPVVWAMQALHACFPEWNAFFWAYVVGTLVVDACFTALLWSQRSGQRVRAVAFWVCFIPLVGPLSIFRFDVIPAVLAGGALLLLGRHPHLAGGLVALGAALKLWPALLVLPLLRPRRTRVQALTGFGVVGGGLALASLLVAGWARTVSPLTWQSHRGLQIESLAATWFMLLRGLGDRSRIVVFSQFNAFELVGDGVDAAMTLTTALTVLGLAAIIALTWRYLHAPHVRRDTAGLLMLTIIAIMVVTNKTLSPQYVLWLGGPLAIELLNDADLGGTPARRRWLTGGVLAIAALTNLVYPVCYNGLLVDDTDPVAVAALVVRNVLLLVLAVAAYRLTWLACPRVERRDSLCDTPGRAAASSIESGPTDQRDDPE